MSRRRVADATRAAALAVTVVLALGVSACAADGDHGGDHQGGVTTGGPAASSSADHAEADVTFAASMVPHHLQAVEMADLVPDRTKDPEVRDLAERIRAAQQAEIERMTGWLAAWGATPMDQHGHEEGEDMDGMVSDDDLVELGALRDAAFDRRWLELMVEHHEGAVAMAQTVVREGRHAGTRALADEVIVAQQEEIAEMKALLGR